MDSMMYELGSVADECLLQTSMEGFLHDCYEMNAVMEAEGPSATADKRKFNGKEFIKKTGEKLKNFVDASIRRFLGLINAIIQRAGEMAQAFSNKMHRKAVPVPSNLYNAYTSMLKETTSITEIGNLFVRSLSDVFKMHFDDKEFPKYFRDKDTLFSEHVPKLKESVKKIEAADILKDNSISDFLNDETAKAYGDRKATIKPNEEQKKLDDLRKRWNKIREAFNGGSRQIQSMLKMMYAMTDEASDNYKALGFMHKHLNEVFAANMAVVTGMMAVISRLQRYVSAFIKLDKMMGNTREMLDGDAIQKEREDRFERFRQENFGSNYSARALPSA